MSQFLQWVRALLRPFQTPVREEKSVAPMQRQVPKIPRGGRLIPGVPIDDEDGIPHIVYDIEDNT